MDAMAETICRPWSRAIVLPSSGSANRRGAKKLTRAIITLFVHTIAMPLSSKLDRKLRAAEESSDGEEYYEVTDRSSSPSVIETGQGGELLDSEEEDGSEDEEMVRTVTFTIPWF